MRKTRLKTVKSGSRFRINWRVIWYSVLVWMAAFLVSSLVFLPLFYVVLPLLVLLLTVYYFDTKEAKDNVLGFGFAVSIAWFFAVCIFSALEIAGFYYFDLVFYFSDFRNWFLFPLVLLIPVVYSIILDNLEIKKIKKHKKRMVQPGGLVTRHAYPRLL